MTTLCRTSSGCSVVSTTAPATEDVYYVNDALSDSDSECGHSSSDEADDLFSPESTPVPSDYSQTPSRKKPAPRLICFLDFDDTLFPTSVLKHPTERIDEVQLQKFCLSAYETILDMIRRYGEESIYIVSNADKSWIEKCLKLLTKGYFLSIYHLISLYNLKIISAKDEFAAAYPNDPTKWKQMVFESLVRQHHNEYCSSQDSTSLKPFGVICIGDQLCEWQASKRCIERLNSTTNHETAIILHRMKLISSPSLADLISQYELIKKIAGLFQSQLQEIDIDYGLEQQRFLRNN